MATRERSIMRWIRQKWAALTNSNKLVILNHLSVPSSGLFVTSEQLPYTMSLQARPPYSGEWSYEWRWVTAPIRGVTVAPMFGSYTSLTLDGGAEIGVLARLECVAWCEGVEYRSAPYSVQVLPLSSDV